MIRFASKKPVLLPPPVILKKPGPLMPACLLTTQYLFCLQERQCRQTCSHHFTGRFCYGDPLFPFIVKSAYPHPWFKASTVVPGNKIKESCHHAPIIKGQAMNKSFFRTFP